MKFVLTPFIASSSLSPHRKGIASSQGQRSIKTYNNEVYLVLSVARFSKAQFALLFHSDDAVGAQIVETPAAIYSSSSKRTNQTFR